MPILPVWRLPCKLSEYDSFSQNAYIGGHARTGTESLNEHQKIVDYIKESDFEKVWLVGEQFASVCHSFKTYANVQEVIKELETNKPKGYTILIKGSNGIKLSSTVEYL